MFRILVANSKGGCGKTTLTTSLAGYFAAPTFPSWLSNGW